VHALSQCQIVNRNDDMSGHLIGYEQLACEIDKEANFKEHREMGSDLRQFPVNIASRKKKIASLEG